jgi:hypothetical protein
MKAKAGYPSGKISNFFEIDRMSTSKLCFLEKVVKQKIDMEVDFRAVLMDG